MTQVDYGVDVVQRYSALLGKWEERYTGWFVPLKNRRTCGHKHETEDAAEKCAISLLTKARRESP